MPTTDHSVSPASGLELASLHPDVRPGDDLFRHVNQRWLDDHPIPADKSMYGAFSILAERAEKHVQAIAKESAQAAEGSIARKVGDAYTSFMDQDTVNRLGHSPLLERLHLIQEAGTDKTELLRQMARAEKRGVAGLWQMFIDNDPGQPDRYIAFVEQGGLSLPDESYYRLDDFAEIRDAFVRHLSRVADLLGDRIPSDFASQVMAVETEIARTHWDQVRCRDAHATYNLMTLEEWRGSIGEFPLTVWLDEIGLRDSQVQEVVIRQPSAVEAWPHIWNELSGEQLSSWIQWQVIRALSGYLSDDLVEAHFDFFGRTLSGTPELRPRWKRAVAFTESILGEAVGQVYVERHFPPESKAQMDELVGNLLEAYRQSIMSLEWMSETTKEKALEKLATFRPKVGYPDRWKDYSSLLVSSDDLVGNLEAAAAFEFSREVGKLGKPVDKDEWFMTPQTVNAYYNPGFNEIVFPAAILQYPFFDPERDAAANYGGIGAVIGHEIGHGFDDQGSRFDGEGRLVDWWTEEDRTRFDELTRVLVDQFATLEPRQLPGHRVNGELTLGENIGDLGGLGIAWKAYLLSLGGEDPPVVDGQSAAQRFFISWAQSWRLAARDEEAKRLLQIDPHSPAEFRCNQIVRNLPEFYDAFGVSEADELWLEPERRVAIW